MPELTDEPGRPETLPLSLALLYSSLILGKESKAGLSGQDELIICDGLWTSGQDGVWTTGWGGAWMTGQDEAWMLGRNEVWMMR